MSYLGRTENKSSDIRRFDVTSSTSATHTLSWTPPNELSLIVTINGVKQHEDAYSVSGTTLTLTSALVAEDKLEVIGISDIGTTITPAQNSVTTQHIADGAITTAKIAADTIIAVDVAANAITSSELADDAVDTAAIADNAVTLAKMAGIARGKIIYGNASGDPAVLTVGTTGQFLTSDGSDASWGDVSELPTQTSKDGYTLITDGTDASWSSRPNRNVLINGDHRISQRGTTFTPSTASGSSMMYTLDRYYAYRSAGTNDGICNRVIGEAPQGFNYHMRMGRADNSSETGGYMRIGQQIEYLNCFGMAGQTCCFSFYMKKHANFACNNFGIVISTGTGEDQPAWDTIGGGWSTGVSSYNNTSILNDLTTSWVRRYVTVAIPLGTKEIAVAFSFNAWTGTNITSDYVDVAGMQFEIGSVPSAFDHKPIQRELMDCGRFYQRIPGPFLIPTASTTAIASGGARTTTAGQATLIYWATMRTNPSFTGSGTMYMHDLADGGNITITSFGTANTIGLSRCWLNCGSSGTMAAGDSIIFYGSGGSGDYFALDAEL